jgi:hypothetical protein
VRKRSFAPGILLLVVALALPALIIAQQNRSARRTTNPDRSAAGGNATGKVESFRPCDQERPCRSALSNPVKSHRRQKTGLQRNLQVVHQRHAERSRPALDLFRSD